MLPEIGRFYAIKEGEYTKNFAFAMAVDSSFLLLFSLQDLRLLQDPSLDADTIDFCKIYRSPILDDILKLENQIPLFVLKRVFEEVKEALLPDARDQDFNGLLLRLAATWTPFGIGRGRSEEVILDAEPHLLGCMQRFVSKFLHIQIDGKDSGAKPKLQRFLDQLVIPVCLLLPEIPSVERRFLKGVSAGQLVKAWIKFKSFDKLSDNIRFDEHSGTLYLPEICISEMHTEVFLRNMVALEYNDATRPKSVTRYVGLMGCLVQSPDDVRLLIEHVILPSRTLALTNECTVKMWKDVRQPFTSIPFVVIDDKPFLSIGDELSMAFFAVLYENYYKTKIKRTLSGLFDKVSSWKFWAPVGVFLGLAMTAIQTYCSVYQLASSGNTSGHAA